jgi:dienelactone hydrolase
VNEAVLEGFTPEWVSAEGATRRVWRAGAGPAVVIMPEVPGMTPEVMRFARRVAERGFSVWVTEVYGVPGEPRTVCSTLRTLGQVCVSREFTLLARGQSSPITAWLRAVCRLAHAACGGPGVGAIGMCMTGNFALSLMLEEAVVAPVLSQPSLPLPASRAHTSELGISAAELAVVKRRAAEGVGVLGLRFTHDALVPAARFRRLRGELGAGFEGIEINSGPGNPHGIPRLAHSVVTNDLVDAEGHPTRAALDRVLGFFEERLLKG